MTEEWEYIEEEITRNQTKEYLNSCPLICQKCRWLDWYYEQGCSHGFQPVEEKCLGYTNGKNYKRFKWFGYDLNWQWWRLKVWGFKKLGMEPNYVGSWRQWEYNEDSGLDEEEDNFGFYHFGSDYGDLLDDDDLITLEEDDLIELEDGKPIRKQNWETEDEPDYWLPGDLL